MKNRDRIRRAREMAAELGDAAREKAEEILEAARDKAEDVYEGARHQAEDAWEHGTEYVEGGFDEMHVFMKRQWRERPVAVAATAVGIGLLLGLAMRGGPPLMLDRATDDVIAIATAAAAAVVAVFAAGFALYAAFLPVVGPAWSAFIVSGAAAFIVVMLALFANMRSRAKQRAAELAQADVARQLPATIAGLARDHPIAALLTSVIGGAVAARHPRLARDLVALLAQLRG